MKTFLSMLIAAMATLAISGCSTATVTCTTDKNGNEHCTAKTRPW